MFKLVRADIQRVTHQESNISGKLGVILFNPGLHAVLFYRLSRWLYLHHLQFLAVLISYFNSVLTGAQISPRAVIGKGLSIYHPYGMVIGADTVIGDYCTLVQGNTIGQHYGGNDRPTIGDRFYAGTGAKILGKIEIGNNVRVGANAVVLNSLPDGVMVAALPARIIRQGGAQPQQAEHGPSTGRKAILEQLLPLLKSTIGVDIAVEDIGEPMGLLGEGIGLDSIEMLRLIGMIEEAFQLTIDDDELDAAHFKTIGSLVSFIQERLSPC